MNATFNPLLLSTAVHRATIGGPDEDVGAKRFLIVLPGELADAVGIRAAIELMVGLNRYQVRFGLSEANDPTQRRVLCRASEPAEPGAQAAERRYAMLNPAHAALDLVRLELERMQPLDLAA